MKDPTHWASLSQAERDAAYDNRAAVPAAPELIRRREEASAMCRTEGRLDLAYGPHRRQQWDLFPASSAASPCLVFIHGGYWMMNRREDFCSVMAGVRCAGWSAALPGYRLAPEASLCEIVADIRRALDWLAANRAAHGIAGPILLAGWSAGGHLAAMALDHPVVAAGLAISGVFDLAPLRQTYLQATLRLTEADLVRCSPLELPIVDKKLTIAYGTAELPALIDDSRALHARRAASGAPGRLVPVEAADHFTILDQLEQADGVLLRAALASLP
jgi:arylformamidase